MCSTITKVFEKQGKGIGYKVFKNDDRKLKSLFCFCHESTTSGRQPSFFQCTSKPENWNTARNVLAYTDSVPAWGRQTEYLSGFHLFETKEDAIKYFEDCNYSGEEVEVWEVEYDEKMYEGYENIFGEPGVNPTPAKIIIANKLKPIKMIMAPKNPYIEEIQMLPVSSRLPELVPVG